MNTESKKQVIKITALVFLAMLFSTNYYGGNALFFLGDKTLFALRIFFAASGLVLFIMYLGVKNKEERELTEQNGRFYTQEAVQKIDRYGISKENIELAIQDGIKKEGRLSTLYIYSAEDIGVFTVVLNNKGYIVNVLV
jgi:hypothetical protein